MPGLIELGNEIERLVGGDDCDYEGCTLAYNLISVHWTDGDGNRQCWGCQVSRDPGFDAFNFALDIIGAMKAAAPATGEYVATLIRDHDSEQLWPLL
jgi:hypothetical protein